jgi:tetratricopeptide (TPR) repeat protein
MIKGDYPAAIAGFQSILDVNPNYPNAANLMNVARSGARNAAQLAVDSGNQAEMSSDYAGAAKQYERALQLDPASTSAADAMRRLKLRMQREGEDALKRARTFQAAGNKADAITAYEKALKLLPGDHPDVKSAHDQLSALKGS